MQTAAIALNGRMGVSSGKTNDDVLGQVRETETGKRKRCGEVLGEILRFVNQLDGA